DDLSACFMLPSLPLVFGREGKRESQGAVGNVWSAARLQADFQNWKKTVCANVSGLFLKLPLLATMESAHRCPKKWVELKGSSFPHRFQQRRMGPLNQSIDP